VAPVLQALVSQALVLALCAVDVGVLADFVVLCVSAHHLISSLSLLLLLLHLLRQSRVLSDQQ
jgi:hypothetical protein